MITLTTLEKFIDWEMWMWRKQIEGNFETQVRDYSILAQKDGWRNEEKPTQISESLGKNL